ncbi:hypothetical protein VCHSUH04_05865 [Veillonella sp. T14073-2]|uniref:hypothetical protein n=1 Tax=Veillonella sp. T14073-2 TaxID=1911680 RepID=UPI000CF42072|nr:hypothetical protein [Veillonella sp. T14073-2]PQL22446.1 hypothetical protein VCHSUH04_05865 [Veillonella sp. T14073-2]
MIEVFLPPPFVVEVFNLNEAVRISLAIFTSVVLVFVDTFLRVLVEARNFNLATNREITIKNTILAIIWRGWAPVEINGKIHRFLVSGKLRADMTKKLVKSYPWLFLLSFILLTLPDVDIPMLGRIDVFLSTLLYLVPIMVELASIVENMIELEFVESIWFKRAMNLVKELIALVKSIKDAIK